MTAPAGRLNPPGAVVLAQELAKLPELPSEIVYFDEFAGERRIIEVPALRDAWKMRVHGIAATLDFATFPPGARPFLKSWAHWLLSQTSPATLRSHYWRDRGLARIIGGDVFTACLGMEPMKLRSVWHVEIQPRTRWNYLVGLKSFLQFACAMSLGHLRPEHRDFVSGFRLGPNDKYANVRSGRVFLTMNEESALVDYFDDLNARIRSGQDVEPDDLRDACILLLAYQYGFRPLQITRFRDQDVKLHEMPGGGPVVHVTSETVKQRWSAQRYGMVRSMKREWAFMFRAFLAHRRAHPERYPQLLSTVPGSLFGMYGPRIAESIGRLTASITGVRRSANELRHTAAQRLVDAGATREELAEFLGHTSRDTCLVYFESSPTQAALINKALAVSPVYSAIVEVARTRTIDKAALMKVGPDHQIGGSPHGIPIAGIGACELGQSLCVKNPVLSCYGCRKFLPVTDAAAHREVLDSLDLIRSRGQLDYAACPDCLSRNALSNTAGLT